MIRKCIICKENIPTAGDTCWWCTRAQVMKEKGDDYSCCSLCECGCFVSGCDCDYCTAAAKYNAQKLKETRVWNETKHSETNNRKLNSFIDGNALCIVKEDFINLQESDAVFIELSEKKLKEIKELIEK